LPVQVRAYTRRLREITGTARTLPQLLFWLVLPLLGQYVLNRYVFFTRPTRFRDGRRGNSWLRFRFLYAIYEYLLVLPNMGIGFLFVLFRVVLAPFLGCYYLFAVDACLFPGATASEAWDPAFSSYVSVAAHDHRYNNPILMVFIGIMQDSLSEYRLGCGRMKVKREVYRRLVAKAMSKSPADGKAVEATDCFPGRGCLPLRSGPPAVRLPSDVTPGGDVLSEPTGEVRARWLKRRHILNRWQLARMLLCNPSLIQLRAHHLAYDGIDGFQLDLDEMGSGLSRRVSRARDSFSSAASPLRDRASLLRNKLEGPVKEFGQKVSGPMKQFGEQIASSPIAGATRKGWESTVDAAKTGWQATAEGVPKAWGAAVDGSKKGWESTVDAAKATADSVTKRGRDGGEERP